MTPVVTEEQIAELDALYERMAKVRRLRARAEDLLTLGVALADRESTLAVVAGCTRELERLRAQARRHPAHDGGVL